MAKGFLGYEKEEEFLYPLENLKKHFIALGSSGSGKTVLSKTIIEECIKNNIPSIIVDPQGDLASLGLNGDDKVLKEKGLSDAEIKKFKEKADITVFTPISSKGIPICLNPLDMKKIKVDEEEIIPLMNSVANSVTKLLGYDPDKDKGKAAEAIIYNVLKFYYEKNKTIKTFAQLAKILGKLDEEIKQEIQPYINSDKEIDVLIKKLNLMDVGEKKLLFQFGVPINIDLLLGKNKPKEKDAKTHVSVIYLNTLPNQKDKEFFLSILTTQLYQWMLDNPSDTLQCMYYIDEIAPFLPAGARKPIPKPILKLLFKQARKYGVGCLIATQNPGDIDYKAFAQFGSWAIGRLSVKQDQKKVESALKSLSTEDLSTKLPKLKPGNFLLFAPDIRDNLVELNVRWLHTQHSTLTEDDVKDMMKDKHPEYKKYVIQRETAAKKTLDEEGHLCFESISLEDAHNIAEKNKKKSLLFGAKEELVELKRYYMPYYQTTVRVKEKKFMKKETIEYNVFFNAVTGNILKIQGKNIKESILFEKLLAMKPKEQKIVGLLNKKRYSSKQLTEITGYSHAFIVKTIKILKRDDLVEYKEEGKEIKDIVMNTDKLNSVSSLTSNDYEIDTRTLETESTIIKPKINMKNIEKLLEKFIENTEITQHELIYLVQYQAKLVSKNKTRVMKINGYNGKIEE